MNKETLYLETGSTDPRYNLAFEEYVLTHRLEGDYLLLWQNDNTIVIGQNQNAEAEINRSFVEQHHINVVRRMTCGGAVYQRDDDKPETVKKRLDVYHAQTQPLIDFYTARGVLKTVDGTVDMKEVFTAITDILG